MSATRPRIAAYELPHSCLQAIVTIVVVFGLKKSIAFRSGTTSKCVPVRQCTHPRPHPKES